jgi:mannose-6-phosphate isomerase-like protein (cupin superfamily)
MRIATSSRIEVGQGEIWVDGVVNKVKADDGIIVPAGAKHNVAVQNH